VFGVLAERFFIWGAQAASLLVAAARRDELKSALAREIRE
jgi:hypothetical protein